MAGDTAMTDRGCYCGQVAKVFRNDAGMLFGFAGDLTDLPVVHAWFAAGAIGDPPLFKDDSEGLIVHPDGRVEWIGSRSKRAPIVAPYHALGSGFRIAMGALAAGVSAERAVEIACDLDTETRRPVMVLRRG